MNILGTLGLFFFGKSLMLLKPLNNCSKKKIQIEQNSPIMRMCSDHGREFENAQFEEYCRSYGIQHEFSSPITPQQNGVVEQKNRVLQEMAQVMIHSKNLAQQFWGEAVNTTCHIISRVYLRPETSKTPYEIW
jgi:hypothetical protein